METVVMEFTDLMLLIFGLLFTGLFIGLIFGFASGQRNILNSLHPKTNSQRLSKRN